MNTETSALSTTAMSDRPPPELARKRDRARLLQVTEALIREFAESLPAGVVIACVTRCRTELAAAGVRNGLTVATESAARIRLTALTTTRGCPVSV